MRLGLARAVVAPALLFVGVVWFIASFRNVHRDALGVVRLADTQVEPGSFPKRIVDPAGRQVLVPGPPQRIVSLMLGADEVLTLLVDPARIRAVNRFADDPIVSTCAERVPKHAVRIRGVDPESILALEPDMVFVAGYTLESAVRILMNAGIPVVRFDRYDSFADVETNARMIGRSVGEEERAEAVINEMWSRLSRVAERVAGRPRPRVLYYSPVGYTEGSRSLVNEKIERAGGTNVVAETGLHGPVHVGEELLMALNPEVVIVPRWSPDQGDVRQVLSSPGWQEVRAVRTGRVYALDVKWLTSVAPDGALGVEQLARLLHPGAFAS